VTATGDEVLRRRLRAQRLSGAGFASVEEAVGSLLAVQAQDYGPARWSVGMRVADADDAAVERAVAAGSILRTHVLRPTWHFVLPGDLRWLLTVTAPRIRARDAGRLRQLGLDAATLARSGRLLAEALQGGRALTRNEAAEVLQRGRVATDGQRLPYLLMHAELDALVCSGPRQGAQHTYMLLDERAPETEELPRDAALARLALRYVAGHGPATERDLAAWASLTLTEARAALQAAGGLIREEVAGRAFWAAPGSPDVVPGKAASGVSAPGEAVPQVRLVHTYDEYIMGFRESRDLLALSGRGLPERWTPLVLVDGREAGSWRRTLGREIIAEVALRRPLAGAEIAALEAEAARFSSFCGRRVRLRVESAGLDQADATLDRGRSG
jgi:hypothetical protein